MLEKWNLGQVRLELVLVSGTLQQSCRLGLWSHYACPSSHAVLSCDLLPKLNRAFLHDMFMMQPTILEYC